MKCVMCLKDTGGAHRCSECNCYVHVICGVSNDGIEGYGASVLCILCDRTKNAVIQRKKFVENLSQQAEKMKNLSDKKFPPVEKGLTVLVPIPDVDKGRGDARNILALVMEVADDGFYRLGTRNGILKQLYSRSQFSPCRTKMLNIEDRQKEKEVSLRTVATKHSLGTGQGFVKCSCKKNVKATIYTYIYTPTAPKLS
ncbi:uncharacterized protein LOC122507427 [Leptopilina heterotoma]|uniref:uncharacterized protein LOC122507427 n=1 Tax=Leptopilina heterotoma TaxID=63436 RepID=UPI001CAA3370|nr:uncharacterized protein LOC122507427 [Leptopilina heterotoma]